jgi:hypothetical protein
VLVSSTLFQSSGHKPSTVAIQRKAHSSYPVCANSILMVSWRREWKPWATVTAD